MKDQITKNLQGRISPINVFAVTAGIDCFDCALKTLDEMIKNGDVRVERSHRIPNSPPMYRLNSFIAS